MKAVMVLIPQSRMDLSNGCSSKMVQSSIRMEMASTGQTGQALLLSEQCSARYNLESSLNWALRLCGLKQFQEQRVQASAEMLEVLEPLCFAFPAKRSYGFSDLLYLREARW